MGLLSFARKLWWGQCILTIEKVLIGIKQILHLYLVVGHRGFTCNFNFPGGVWQGREKLLLRSFFYKYVVSSLAFIAYWNF